MLKTSDQIVNYPYNGKSKTYSDILKSSCHHFLYGMFTESSPDVVCLALKNILLMPGKEVIIMEMTLLQLIQSWHNPVLDKIMVVVFNDFVGAKGEIWVILGLILFLIPKTRRCGICVLVSYLLAYFIGDGILKELIGRVRPCNADPSVPLIVKRHSSYSCPSVHSMLAFASAVSVFMSNKKSGIFTLVFAALIGFSRMYFFVHYPTDVLFGALLGTLIGLCSSLLIEREISSRK